METEVNESTPIEESSEILLSVSKDLDSYTAQYIKESVKRSRTEISEIEMVMTEKRQLLKESSDKLCDLDRKIGDIEKETDEFMNHKKTQMENDELATKKKLYAFGFHSKIEYFILEYSNQFFFIFTDSLYQ